MRRLVPVAVVWLAAAAAVTPAVAAADCPGAPGPCPYSAATVVGARAGGAFRFPQGVAVAPAGRVYVADQFGRDVQVFAADGTPQGDFGTQGLGDAQFSAGIGGLAVDPASGDVFAIDSRANRIERFTSDGAFVGAFGTPGTGPGQFSFGGGTDSDDTAGGGVVVGGGKLWVADTLNDRVQRMDLDGTNADVVSIPVSGGFNIPEGVGWSDAGGGLLYVADNRNDRVVAAHPPASGATLGVVAVTAGAGTGPDGRPALDQPYDVALDASGRAWVASDQNSRLVELGAPAGDATLPFLGVFGSFGAAPGQLEYPRSIAVSPTAVYLAEAGTNRVQIFDQATGAALRSFGFPARAGGDLTLPQGVAADPYGGILVADTFAYRGLSFGPDRRVGFVVGAAKLYDTLRPPDAQPDRFLGLADLAQAPDGTIVGLDSRARRVVRFDAAGTVLGVVARDVVSSQAGTAQGGVAVEPGGAIWVADTGGDVLERLDPVTGAVTRTVGAGQLDGPQGVRLDAAGDLWVADGLHGRVVAFAPGGALLRTVGDTGAVADRLEKPSAVALDGRGRVYVADVARSKVLVYATTTGGYVTQWGVRGTASGEFVHPRGIAVDCAGTVTVADTDANRLQQFVPVDPGSSTCVPRPAPPAPPPAPPPSVAHSAPPVEPPAPRHAARLTLRLGRTTGALSRAGLSLRMSCDVACSVRPVITLRPRAGGRAYRLASGGTRHLAARRAVTVRLRASRTTARGLRRRLGRRRDLRLGAIVVVRRTAAPTATIRRSFGVRS